MLRISMINKIFFSLVVFVLSGFLLEILKHSNVNSTHVVEANTIQNIKIENIIFPKYFGGIAQDGDANSRPVVEDNSRYTTKTNTILRVGYKVVTTVPRGTIVTYISKYGSWYKVKYGSIMGYVKNNYLEKVVSSASNKTVPKGYNVPILMYHAIDDLNGSGINELYVTPKNFEEQMNYLKSAGFTPITFDELPNINNINKPILITFDDGYKNNVNAYNILKKLNDSNWKANGTIFMIGKKIDSKSGLSTKQIKEMSDTGIISFQSHTETHPNLTETTDYKKELGDIKTKLESITGKTVTAIAYPSGQYNNNVITETKKYYQYAVTTIPGIANTGSDLCEMKRVRVSYSTSLESFIYMVNQ